MQIFLNCLIILLLFIYFAYSTGKIINDIKEELNEAKSENLYLTSIINKLTEENKKLREKYNDRLKTLNDVLPNLEDCTFADEDFWNNKN